MIDCRVPPCPFCNAAVAVSIATLGTAVEMVQHPTRTDCCLSGRLFRLSAWRQRLGENPGKAEPFAWLVSGPRRATTVFSKDEIEPFIRRACAEEQDDPDDYTATEMFLRPDSPEPNIKALVDRFLAWPIPRSFSPDCGISFDGRKDDQWNKNKQWPIGTNVFNADEAKAMITHILSDPSPPAHTDTKAERRDKRLRDLFAPEGLIDEVVKILQERCMTLAGLVVADVREIVNHVWQSRSSMDEKLALDARRYQQLKDDPESGRHLLSLLMHGKGTQADLDRMLDRIRASKEAAGARG